MRQCNEADPKHAAIISEWENPSDFIAAHLPENVIRIDVFCTRFPNDQYWVQGAIVDPNQAIQAASISGNNISGEIPFVYNLYAFRPGEWWTNPNIFISQGIEPNFPLIYTVHMWFKDGTYQEVNKMVTEWIWAQ